jgi:hypothetical protein
MQIFVQENTIKKLHTDEILNDLTIQDIATANGYINASDFMFIFKGQRLQLSNNLKIISTIK